MSPAPPERVGAVTGPRYADIRYAVEGSVAHIELHRPEALNAWTPGMGRELLDAVHRAAGDPDVRAVLLTGAGRAFCAGADVKTVPDLVVDGEPDLTSRLRDIYNPIILAVREAPKPFVAGVHGACAGLGVSLALACDLAVAADDAFLMMAFVHIGVVPDGGMTALLTERIGRGRATQLFLLGDKLPAVTALDWGLLNAVHPPTELPAQARALAVRLAAAPTLAVAGTKTALTAAAHNSLADQLALETELQQRLARSADYAEGRAAFVEKRRPAFRGR